MVATLCLCAGERAANNARLLRQLTKRRGVDKSLAGAPGEKYASGLRGTEA